MPACSRHLFVYTSVIGRQTPQAFLVAMLVLAVEPPFARRARRFAAPARLGNFRRLPDQCPQTFQGIRTITLLRAEALCEQAEDTLGIDPTARELEQPGAHSIRQSITAQHIEAQLNRRRDLVDVLTPGPGSTHKTEFQLRITQPDVARNFDAVRANQMPASSSAMRPRSMPNSRGSTTRLMDHFGSPPPGVVRARFTKGRRS